MNNGDQKRKIFKYNLSFYYKSTIIYFIVFILYGVIRGEFIEDSYTLITRDPILYFLAIILVISVAALVYNLIRNMYIENRKIEIYIFQKWDSSQRVIISEFGREINHCTDN